MKKFVYFSLCIAAVVSISAFMKKSPGGKGYILYNQVGYISSAQKMLLVSPDVNDVKFLDAAGKEVLRVTPATAQYWTASGDAVRKVDFSTIMIPGKYTVISDALEAKTEITIASKPYHKLTRSVMKAFYLHRLGMPITEQYAGQWARPAGHPDTIVYIHPTAATAARPAGTVISSPGGWYDAGDYNKYIVNSAISTYTLIRAVEDFPAFYKTLNLNIPESRSGVPDLFSEALYNYRWMLTMQDPNDGGVYHKLTNKNFDGVLMPDKATKDRYVVMKSTAAALDFAAVAAHVAALLADGRWQMAQLGKQSLEQAEKAWAWAMANPQAIYRQAGDIKTGAYGDAHLKDEWFWAACELYLATGKKIYAEAIVANYQKPVTPEWAVVHTLGVMSLLHSKKNLPDEMLHRQLREDFISLVQGLVAQSTASPYGVSISKFVWGSNAHVANEGMLKLFSFKLTGNTEFLYSAMADMNYLLGTNATGYCFVTGYGQRQVKHIHHRPSQADGIDEPQPGFLAGGPNLDTFADCPDDKTRDRVNPAKSFVDMDCSYSTNEIAINWNAPMAYLAGGLDTR